MLFQYSEVTKAFQNRYQIDQSAKVAWNARGQRLRKSGIPFGANTGRGVPAEYGWLQVLSLALAYQLLETGVTPDRTAKLVKFMFNEKVKWMAKDPDHLGYFVARPAAFNDHMKKGVLWPHIDLSTYIRRDELPKLTEHIPAVILIDLERLIHLLCKSFAETSRRTEPELRESFNAWLAKPDIVPDSLLLDD